MRKETALLAKLCPSREVLDCSMTNQQIIIPTRCTALGLDRRGTGGQVGGGGYIPTRKSKQDLYPNLEFITKLGKGLELIMTHSVPDQQSFTTDTFANTD